MMLELTPDHPLVLAAIVLAAIAQDDLTCITVGLFISAGELPTWPALAACFLGTLLGDLGWFFGARYAGRIASRAIPERWLSRSKRVDAAQGLLRRWGGPAIVISRFLPGLRTPVHILSGLVYPKPARACLYFAIAAAVYTPLFVGVSAMVGDRLRLESLYDSYGLSGRLAVIGAAVAFWGALWIARRIVRFHRERRRNP